jgi:hypothetical protein
VLRRFIAAGGITVAIACSLPSSEEFTQAIAVDGGSDGGRAPDAKPRDATTPNIDAGAPIVNLLTTPQNDFEDGKCDYPAFYQSTGQPAKPGHSGSWSCKVCRVDASKDFYSLNPYIVLEHPTVGKRYRATAWVRAQPGKADSQQIALTVRTHKIDPYRETEQHDGVAVDLTEDWMQLANYLDVTRPAEALDIFIAGQTSPGGDPRCFLADDLVVWEEGDTPP